MRSTGGAASTRTVVLLALGVVVSLRLLLCLAAPAQLHHSEEFVNLRLAAAVWGDDAEWEGLRPAAADPQATDSEAELFDYQYQEWDGGTLVVSVFLVPIALLGGLSIGTVKTGAIGWSLGIALAWVILLGRLYGDPGRRWAAIGFAAVPVPYLIISCIHWGNHAESAIFLPLVLLLLVDADQRQAPRTRLFLVACAGLLAGFGTWFSPLSLLPLALILLALPLLLGRRALTAVPLFSLGSLVGFLPWLGRNELASLSRFGAQGVSVGDLIRGRPEGGMTAPDAWVHASWPSYGRWDLDGLWSPEPGLADFVDILSRSGVLLGGLLALVLTAAALRTSSAEARRRLFVLAVVGAFYLLLPLLLDRAWQLGDRRLAPLYPAGWALLLCGVLSLREHPIPARIAAVVLVGLLLLNLGLGVHVIQSWDRPEAPLRPWLHFKLPAAQPHQRIEGGVGDLAAAETGGFYEVFAALMAHSSSGGDEEVRGLGRALVPGPGGIGALRRPAPHCPDRESLERGPPRDVHSVGEAAGFGAGLALRCSRDRDRAEDHCRLIGRPDRVEACLAWFRR